MNDLTISDDLIDIRDVIARVEHLEALRQPGPVDLGDDDNDSDQDLLFAELTRWESLLSDLRGEGGDHEWRGAWYPVTLIRDSYFLDYAQDLARDVCEHDLAALNWPLNCIDWDAAAEQLRQDYNQVDIDSVTYWYR